MKITYEFCRCIKCGEELEMLTEDIEKGIIPCWKCKYENRLDDKRLDSWEDVF